MLVKVLKGIMCFECFCKLLIYLFHNKGVSECLCTAMFIATKPSGIEHLLAAKPLEGAGKLKT